MASFRAILFNKLLRATVKGSWHPDSVVSTLRQRSSAAARFSRRPAQYTTLPSLGCSIDRVEGDGSASSLVLTTLMQARDQGLPLPACAAVLSPLTDATGGGASIKENAERDVIFNPEALDAMLNWYLPESEEASNPLISPLLGNLAGLPPLLLQVGEPELIRDDSVRCAEKLLEAGGVAELQVWADMPHVFQVIPWLPEGNQALQKIVDFVRSHTHDSLGGPLETSTI